MKASELIKRLQRLVAHQGDMDVMIDSGPDGALGIEEVDLPPDEDFFCIWAKLFTKDFKPGEKVQVKNGPFVGMNARVICSENGLVRVLVDVFGKDVEVCLIDNQLERRAV